MSRILLIPLTLSLLMLACDGPPATAPDGAARLAADEALDARGGGHAKASGHVEKYTDEFDWDEDYSFAARLQPDGTARGEWQLHAITPIGDWTLHGDVVCMTILPDGKTVRLGGIIEHSTMPAGPNAVNGTPGYGVVWTVVDDGEGKGSVDLATDILYGIPPEWAELYGWSPEAHCETGLTWTHSTPSPIDAGNIQVKP